MEKKLTFKQVTSLQKKHGYDDIQNMINSGLCWHMEGYVGRTAMNLLEVGACMLPKMPKVDAYGNRVPSRYQLQKGTKGTFQNSQKFWMNFDEEDIASNF